MDFLKKTQKIPKLTAEEESIIEKNTVWIFGSARSGTSWFARDLLSYQTVLSNEPLIGRHLAYTKHSRINQVRDIDFFKSEPRYFFSEKYKETWLYYLRKLIVNRLHAQFETFSKKIIIKEPNGSDGADILSQCMPKSKIIILLRDGRDVIDSLLDARREGSRLQERFQVKPILEKQRINFIEKKSGDWMRLMDRIMKTFEQHDKKLRFLVKYENLRYNTLEELKKIYQFIGIEIDNGELEKIVDQYSFEKIPAELKGKNKVTRSASPGKWKENFSKEEQDLMNSIIDETLNELGY